MWGPFILPFFGLLTLATRNGFRRHAVFYASLAALAALTFAGDWWLSGDAFGYYRTTIPEAGLWPMNAGELVAYPKQMFLPNAQGNWFHGFYFWAALPAATLVIWRRDSGLLPLAWLLTLFLLLEFAPQKASLAGWYTQGHYFRYLAVLVLPVCLLLAHAAEYWLARSPVTATLAIVLFVTISLIQGWTLTYPTRDAFAEAREAAKELTALHPRVAYVPEGLKSRLLRFNYSADPSPPMVFIASPAQRALGLLKRIDGAHLVTGGAWSPYDGGPSSTISLGDAFQLRSQWRLLWTSPHPPASWRSEPTRIWFAKR